MALRRSFATATLPLVLVLAARTSALPQQLVYVPGDGFYEEDGRKALVRLADTDTFECEGRCTRSTACC